MKILQRFILTLCLSVLCGFGVKAANYAWPANWEGVMLQGFYWDSFNDTKWTKLTSQADELSQYFKLIWVPNSAKAASNPGMGYDPVYWFTNHNSSFGTESQLREMIQTYKAKGTGIIEDVVVNHRSGKSNWTDFPAEEWNGRTWKLGPEHICSTDEVKNASGQAKPTGAPDTGEDFNGSRDLDHTNATVQDNVKNYCKFLLEDMGYAGFRYDMVKGYSGCYTKIYNEYSKPTYSVGEYWDGSYDAVAAWIEATGKQSAAFDFPFKYAVNKAFAENNLTHLVWKANGTTPQPAGMIHFGYSQYAVTFIDNHDTARDGSKFTGNVAAANAFMLMSPGTPCVFLSHYKAYKKDIQRLIEVRNAVGLHNNSAVRVLKTTTNCYMAEVTGSKGKLVVKIGSDMASPEGYSNSDIVATGSDYCVWTKVAISGGGGGDLPVGDAPEKLYLMGNLEQGSWETNVGVAMTKNGDKFTASNVTLNAASGETNAFFTFVTALGSTGASTEWDAVINSSDRYGATSKDKIVSVGGSAPIQKFTAGVDASSAYSWGVAPGTYDITADFSTMTMTITTPGGGGGGGGDITDMPAQLYFIGDIKDNQWDPSYGEAMTKDGNKYVLSKVVLEAADPAADCYFSFTDALGTDWDDLNAKANRWGAVAEGVTITTGVAAPMKIYANNVDTSGCKSWSVASGEYSVEANFADMTVTLKKSTSGIDNIGIESNEPVIYYNLQGVRVAEPANGIFIRRQGNKVSKVIIR